MTTYLVTGGSGYFGALITQRLHAAGDSVRVLDLNDTHDRLDGVEFIKGDQASTPDDGINNFTYTFFSPCRTTIEDNNYFSQCAT